MHPIIGITYHPHAKITTLCIPSSAVAGKGRLIAGQFCWINIPAVSPWEWHPFTIVSSPFVAQLSVEMKHATQQQQQSQQRQQPPQQQAQQQQQDQHQLAVEDGEASGCIAFAIKMIGNDDFDDDNNNHNNHNNSNNCSVDNDRSWTSKLAMLARKREYQGLAQGTVRAAKGEVNNVGALLPTEHYLSHHLL